MLIAEIIVIFLLLLCNGLLACAEIAVVASRKAKLQQMKEEGRAGAARALDLANNPTRFLSSIQMGITLVGVLAAAYSGATVADMLGEWMKGWPWVGPWLGNHAPTVAFLLVVSVLTYLSVVLGELVPKQIALAAPEATACLLSGLLHRFSQMAQWPVHLLETSSTAVLRLLGIRPQGQPVVSEDELRILLDQGMTSGVLKREERAMLEGVLELDEKCARDLMTPKARIVYLNLADDPETQWRRIAASGHSFFPVYQDNRDNVVGVVSVKALWANLSLAGVADVKALMVAPLVIPATMPSAKILQEFKVSGRHQALVVDEYGAVEGLVTLNDIMEAIVGDLPEREQRRPGLKKREDGSWLVDGQMEISAVREAVGLPEQLPGEDDEAYQTLAGFVLHKLKRLPHEGDAVTWDGWVFEVVDMDRHRIDKILVRKKD
jgi:putative hemolysin